MPYLILAAASLVTGFLGRGKVDSVINAPIGKDSGGIVPWTFSTGSLINIAILGALAFGAVRLWKEFKKV